MVTPVGLLWFIKVMRTITSVCLRERSLTARPLEGTEKDGGGVRPVVAGSRLRGDAVRHQCGVLPVADLSLCHHHLQVRAGSPGLSVTNQNAQCMSAANESRPLLDVKTLLLYVGSCLWMLRVRDMSIWKTKYTSTEQTDELWQSVDKIMFLLCSVELKLFHRLYFSFQLNVTLNQIKPADLQFLYEWQEVLIDQLSVSESDKELFKHGNLTAVCFLSASCLLPVCRVYKSVIQAVQKSDEGHPFR